MKGKTARIASLIVVSFIAILLFLMYSNSVVPLFLSLLDKFPDLEGKGGEWVM